TGKVLSVTLWQTEETLRASEAAVGPLRSQGAQLVGAAGAPAVAAYAVAAEERGEAPPGPGMFARVSMAQAPPDRVSPEQTAAVVRMDKEKLVPALKRVKG